MVKLYCVSISSYDSKNLAISYAHKVNFCRPNHNHITAFQAIAMPLNIFVVGTKLYAHLPTAPLIKALKSTAYSGDLL